MSITISTGDLKMDYEVLDAIFAMDSNTAGVFKGVDPDKAFEGVKEQLRKKCVQLGGNAVLNCQFDYRIALDGKKQSMEIFAYGTAVKTK